MPIVLSLFLLAGTAWAQTVPDANPFTSPADLARGRHIYNARRQAATGRWSKAAQAEPPRSRAPAKATDRALYPGDSASAFRAPRCRASGG